MKLIFDFLPIVLFFLTFRIADGQKEVAAHWADQHFGFLVSGGVVRPEDAPVLLATLVVIAATVVQIGVLLGRRRRVDTMLWVSLVLVVTLGGATVWFHNANFIKWKPSVLYWAMMVTLYASNAFFGRNLLRQMIGDQVTLPDAVWQRLNWAWIGFFAAMGVLNLCVAYSVSTAAWVNFKLFGGFGLMLLFALAQGVYLNRHAPVEPKEPR